MWCVVLGVSSGIRKENIGSTGEYLMCFFVGIMINGIFCRCFYYLAQKGILVSDKSNPTTFFLSEPQHVKIRDLVL